MPTSAINQKIDLDNLDFIEIEHSDVCLSTHKGAEED